MIFEAVVGVARETPAAFGLALERPAPWLQPSARVARETSHVVNCQAGCASVFRGQSHRKIRDCEDPGRGQDRVHELG